MNTDTQQAKRPRWVVLFLAVVSAVVAFRVATFAMSLVFVLLRKSPFRVIAFVYQWDYLLVPFVSVCAAVLVSRWQERFLERGKPATSYVALCVMTALAFCPIQARVFCRTVMCSPLYLAVTGDYPPETLELLIDRYPRMIDGRESGEDGRCPLVMAAYEGKTNLVEVLVRRGADVDYAVEQLQQLDAVAAVDLVLRYSKRGLRSGQ